MNNIMEYADAASRCEKWTLGLLGDTGFHDCPDAILAYYKAPMGLLATGYANKAAQVMSLLEQRFFDDGDFHAQSDDPTPPAGRSYRNGWIAWAAHNLGAYHLSEPTFDRLERGLHPEFFGSPDNDGVEVDQRIYPAGGTASVANALLAGGRRYYAERAGTFIKKLYDDQDVDADRILLCRDSSGEMIDPDERGITAGIENLVFDLNKPGQICWVFGYSLRVFARLYRSTGDAGWLDTAERVRGWLERADESLYSNITNGKVAWGASEMYGVTGQTHWLTMADRIGSWITSQQEEDGVWVRRPQFSSSSDQPLPVSLDTSIERMFYMIDIPRAFALAGKHQNQ